MASLAAVSLSRSARAPAWQLAPFLLAATVLTAAWPLGLLLLSPLLLGVPHVVADLRYLIFANQAISRSVAGRLLAPLAALTALRVVAMCGGPSWPRLEVLSGVASVALALTGLAGGVRRRAAIVAAAALAAAAFLWPGFVIVGLGHLHNAVAIGLWLVWARASVRDVISAVIPIAAGATAVALGVFDPLTAATGGFATPVKGFDLDSMAAALAPGLGGTLALRLVLLFAFAQALHYAAWLVLIPAARADGAPARTSLVHDLGRPGLGIAILASLAVPVAALFDPATARTGYLSLVVFHGWLEIALLARWWAGGDSASRT